MNRYWNADILIIAALQVDCGWIDDAGPAPSYLGKESNTKNNDLTNRNTTFMTYNLSYLPKHLKENQGIPIMAILKKIGIMATAGISEIQNTDQ